MLACPPSPLPTEYKRIIELPTIERGFLYACVFLLLFSHIYSLVYLVYNTRIYSLDYSKKIVYLSITVCRRERASGRLNNSRGKTEMCREIRDHVSQTFGRTVVVTDRSWKQEEIDRSMLLRRSLIIMYEVSFICALAYVLDRKQVRKYYRERAMTRCDARRGWL